MPWVCPKCERELKSEKQPHYCIKVRVDSLFEGKSDDMGLAFDKLLAKVADWEDVLVSTSKNCIVFVRRYTFLVVKPMKAALDVKFYSATPVQWQPIVKCYGNPGKYSNHIRVASADAITPQAFKYIRASYIML